MKPTRKLPILTLAAAATIALTPAAFAQTTGSGYNSTGARENTSDTMKTNSDTAKTSAMGNVSSGDRAFVKRATMDGIAEVELGKLAADKASSDDVKTFAKQMVDDHTKANDELKTLAASKGIDLPTDTDKSHKAKMSKLQNLSGAEFDKAYVKEQIKDHDSALKLFRKEADKGKDADLKSFAQKTVPALEQHQQHVDQVASSVGVKTGRRTLPAAGSTGMSNMNHEKSGTSTQGGGSSNPNPNP